MANEFDAYREALVVEHTTVWPEEYDNWPQADRLALRPCCTPSRKKRPNWITCASTRGSPGKLRSRPRISSGWHSSDNGDRLRAYGLRYEARCFILVPKP